LNRVKVLVQVVLRSDLATQNSIKKTVTREEEKNETCFRRWSCRFLILGVSLLSVSSFLGQAGRLQFTNNAVLSALLIFAMCCCVGVLVIQDYHQAN
jgi:hypothetical protein